MMTQTQIQNIVDVFCEAQIREKGTGRSDSGLCVEIRWVPSELEFQILISDHTGVQDIVWGLGRDIQATLEDLAADHPDLIQDFWENLEVQEYYEEAV